MKLKELESVLPEKIMVSITPTYGYGLMATADAIAELGDRKVKEIRGLYENIAPFTACTEIYLFEEEEKNERT